VRNFRQKKRKRQRGNSKKSNLSKPLSKRKGILKKKGEGRRKAAKKKEIGVGMDDKKVEGNDYKEKNQAAQKSEKENGVEEAGGTQA